MIVIHCTETLQGGVATYLNEILRVRSNQIKYWIVAPQDQIKFLTCTPDRLITYEPSRRRIISAVRLARLVNRIIERERESDQLILHVHSSFAGLGVRILSSTPSSKIVYCPHGWAFDQKVSPALQALYRLVERSLSRRCRFVVCISKHEYSEAQRLGIDEKKLILIRNGIGDLDDIAYLEKEADFFYSEANAHSIKGKLIVFAGRIDTQKGVGVLRMLPARLPGDRFIYIGSPVLGEEVLKWPENVTYLGWMPTDIVRSYMKRADLVIVPSLWEGFGLVAVEAMQQRAAVFASNVGALKEIIVDGVTGRLIADYESADAFATAIMTTKKDELRKMGDAGYQRQQEYFTAKQLVVALEKLYLSFNP